LLPLARKCHWTGFIGGGIGSVLLIADLGRPERFLAMLRVLRVRSPMSVGSWILAVAPPCAGAAAVFCDPYSSLAAGVLGIPLSGYTAVLLSNTAVPVWHEARASLPGDATRQAWIATNTFGIAGSIVELMASAAVERDVNRVSAVGKPLREGGSGALWKVSKAMTIAGLALSIFGRSRSAQRTGALLGTAGAIALRFAVFHAGKASARDPRATFHLQRDQSAAIDPPAAR
jgi:formate-dependent nitrite reductase membrane component NrfD